MTLSRRRVIQNLTAATSVALTGMAMPALADATVLQVYKSPLCGCCGAWVEHMRSAGMSVRVTEIENVGPIKRDLGVPEDLQSCHTAVIDGYVIEGHVPARELARLLRERPAATGLAVPDMPIGSPGMEQGDRVDPYRVILFSGADRMTYARY